jgi:hypothetical protein
VTRHENETFAKMGTHPLNRAIEHVARQGRHHHITKDNLKITRENFVHALHPVLDGHDVESMRVQEVPHDIAKLHIVFEEKDFPLHVLPAGEGEAIGEIHSGGVLSVALHGVLGQQGEEADAVPFLAMD